MKRIGVIVVHGIGEQKRFEHLEEIACNLYRAVRFGPQKRQLAHIQLRHGDQVPHLSKEESWQEAPAIVSWQDADGKAIEVIFREVHWADLDMKMGWSQWFKFVGWALGVSGVSLFNRCNIGTPEEHGMYQPKSLTWQERTKVRAKLFLTSLVVFMMLITVDLLCGLINRFRISIPTLSNLQSLIYDYLGDVKLYQDWFVRNDNHLEVIGEKSRVAIRRRMIRTLVQTSSEVHKGNLDEFFVFAHSLGTVVAFNGLMETELALPNYLTREEWELPDYQYLKTQAGKNAPDEQMPQRAPWLNKRDAISRAKLFDGLKGFLTMGSPLDKFAALWPATVPINSEAIPGNVPWFNIVDVQDIVAGEIDLLYSPDGTRGDVGGLVLHNVNWADQNTLFTAHTSYWKAEQSVRLIDQVVSWFESPNTQELRPESSMPESRARITFSVTLLFIILSLPVLTASVAWLLAKSGKIIEAIARYTTGITQTVWPQIIAILDDGSYLQTTLYWSGILLTFGCAIVLLFSLIRLQWEKLKFKTIQSQIRRNTQ